jgi:hypothetical protein
MTGRIQITLFRGTTWIGQGIENVLRNVSGGVC